MSTLNVESLTPSQIYLNQLKRCYFESITQIGQAIDHDLDVYQLKELCRHLGCSVSEVVERVAEEVGYHPRPRGPKIK
jgi:AraC-like DNA-binding protein